jgi:hypothetical protein
MPPRLYCRTPDCPSEMMKDSLASAFWGFRSPVVTTWPCDASPRHRSRPATDRCGTGMRPACGRSTRRRPASTAVRGISARAVPYRRRMGHPVVAVRPDSGTARVAPRHSSHHVDAVDDRDRPAVARSGLDQPADPCCHGPSRWTGDGCRTNPAIGSCAKWPAIHDRPNTILGGHPLAGSAAERGPRPSWPAASTPRSGCQTASAPACMRSEMG